VVYEIIGCVQLVIVVIVVVSGSFSVFAAASALSTAVAAAEVAQCTWLVKSSCRKQHG